MNPRQKIYANQESVLRQLLPEHWRAPWDIASGDTVAAVPGNADRSAGMKPLGLWEPSSRVMLLSHVLAYWSSAAALLNPVTDFPGLIDNAVAQAILDGPLSGYAAATRAMTLRYMSSFASRCMGLDASTLFLASKRILAEEPRTDRSELIRKFEEYWTIARSLDPQMEPGEQHGLDTAVWSRRAAKAIIAVEVAPRASELAGLGRKHITIDGNKAIVVIPASLSKAGVSQVRDLSPEGSLIVKEYVGPARDFLLKLAGHESEIEDLWLTRKGFPLSYHGVIATLRLDMAKRAGSRVCCNYLRSALVSQREIDQTLAGNLLGHRIGSHLANDRYAIKDYRQAVADMGDVWTAYD